LNFKISSRFLPTGYLEKIIFDTLGMYLKGENLTDSPLVKWGRDTLKQGIWWYHCKNESDIQRRQKEVIQLYHSIKEKGYNGSVITTYIDDNGRIKTYDGFHRLCIMKFLGITADVNVTIRTWATKQVNREGDFPLEKTLMELNSKKAVYTPVDDPRVEGWTVWRKDSPKRLEYILTHIKGKTVLDIGCCEGYFTLELAKRGFNITTIDTTPKRIAVTRYLATKKELLDNVTFKIIRWEDFLKANVHFDNILFLSVFHHNLLKMGVDGAFKALERFRGKAYRLFFESPLSSQKIGWLEQDGLSHKKDLYSFTEEEFKAKIETVTGYVVKDIWREGIRPIFVLEAIR